jgi:cobalt-precorrin 5A hydrolase/precorrin-3B C17-methyltransferase
MKPAIITFAPASMGLAGRIAEHLQAEIFACGSSGHEAKTLLPRLFAEQRPIIGICAAGILIRLLAPVLSDKHVEPPVLAISSDGASVVPLLGGHHGANDLARQLAGFLNAHAAVTTASDSRFTRALDEPPEGWVLADPHDAKPAMMAALVGAKLAVEGHAPWLAEAGYPLSHSGAVKVLVSEQQLKVDRGLVYHPKTLVVGVGCERGTAPIDVIDLIDFALKSENLSPRSIAAIATVELKADEAALHAAAAHFGVPLRLYSVDELNLERYRLSDPSPIVEAEIGTPSVAEAAALKAGILAVRKIKGRRSTCAIGKALKPIDATTLGRPPGVLHLVGIGPGEAASRTAAVVDALAASADWVGYGLYLDLIADLRDGQAEHRFPLGDEEPRVRHALELAGQGKVVALVCSGDAQIYAMAALVYELLDATGARALSDNARRVAVESHPGISALQAASAAAGALIGHDFCAISLSDLLTPREDILKRLEGAAKADFVTAFYNPRSQRRTDLIEEAKTVFLAHRPADTPVIVGRSLGRPEQQVEVTTLSAFDPATIDMLTIVLFGSSTSRAFTRGDGKTVAFTPRGYERKERADAV